MFSSTFLISFSSISTIVNTFIALVCIYILAPHVSNYFCNVAKKSKKLPLPPGPTPWPLIGSAVELLRKKPVFRWLHTLMKEMDTEIACVRFGNVHVITVTCPKLGLEFLKEHDALFASRPCTMATDVFSFGYLSTSMGTNGEQWKKMRKVLMSDIVSSTRLQWLHDRRVEEADNLIKYVYNICSNVPNNSSFVNIRHVARHYAGNVTRKMVFSKRYFGAESMECYGPGVEEEAHVEALFAAIGIMYGFCISDYFPFLVGLDLDGTEKKVKEIITTLNKLHDPLINQRIQLWRNGKGKKEQEDLLDVLINLKDNDRKYLLSNQEIRAQTLEIMTASIDNPSNAVEWAMAEMICQPELLAKAVEELDSVVGKERLVQESDIQHLNFLKSCAREALRLHPIAPFNFPHVATSDVNVAGYFIPEGSHVLLSRIGLGRNAKVWDDPHKFKPERHMVMLSNQDGECAENVVLTEPGLRFISFTTGRRGCPAVSLGTAMTVMLFARLVQGFSWSMLPNVTSIDLAEGEKDLCLAKLLMLQAKPRLPLHLYQEL